jgi:sec-independent protein translocase protein TatC
VLALAILAALAATVGAVAGTRRGAADATFWGHFGELRRRLVRIVLGVLAGILVAFLIRIEPVAPWVGFDAYDNLAAQVFRRMAADLVPDGVALVVTAPTAGFVALFNVALALGVVVSLPYVLAQLAGFLGPALRRHERALLLRLLLPAFLLFVLGILFAYAFVLPSAFAALYAFADTLGAATFLDVEAFVSFALLFMLLTGAAFQTPLVMYGLARVGLATPRGYLRKWRHAVVAIVLIAALATPDPTPVSQMLVSAPLLGLYLLGAALAVPAAKAYARSLAH